MTNQIEAVATANKTIPQITLTTFLTVKMLCEKHPVFKEGGVRNEIFHANTNGLAESGALIRRGRKILLDETLYLSWVRGGEK